MQIDQFGGLDEITVEDIQFLDYLSKERERDGAKEENKNKDAKDEEQGNEQRADGEKPELEGNKK